MNWIYFKGEDKVKLKQGINSDFFIFEDPERLDPVTVIIKDEKGKGKLIIECFGESWSTYFGSIGGKSLIKFIAGLGSDYLGNRLISNTFHRPTKRETNYVDRISQAVIDACKFKVSEDA